MANEVMTFNFGMDEVRTVGIDGEPWFVAKNVCEVFGDSNYRRSISRLDEDEKGVSPFYTSKGKQNFTVVNETGLYSLLFHMQPQKKKTMTEEQFQERVNSIRNFKRWITHEVLPSIRKHGAYTTDYVLAKTLDDPEYLIGLIRELKNVK
ncbi:BRO-N domain-containing protein [Neobacillus massiliamazoniensis]|uniref:Prophage antirepressor n=1 Tax=Neobacillus massiliamazoniensis TaxID=1499688 RepID=A0A0U1NQS1_9BACI|nr:BRO family protein [Neobacillus massiliamazoniensis]CRK80391.1 prophage antirepressor [Neobacillus massiliamazoniensis]